MKSPALVFWLTLAIGGSIAYGSYVAWRKTQERAAQHAPRAARHVVAQKPQADGPPVKEFQLTERSGQEFDSKDLAGKVWIGSIFFASCPGACWQMNQALKAVHDEITDPDFRLVSITCDPENDTPQALTAYADRLLADRAKWVFLTGHMKDIQRVGRDVLFQDVQPATHTFHAQVIDRDGQVRGSFDMLDAAKVDELKKLVRELLAHKPSTEPGRPATTNEATEPQTSNRG